MIKFSFLILLTASTVFSVCYDDPQVTKLQKGKTAIIYVECKPFEELQLELLKNREVKMWSDDQYNTALSLLPRGGSLEIEILASSIGAADASNFRFFATNKNKDTLAYFTGDKRVPRWSRIQEAWWSIEIANINQKITAGDSIFLYIIDNVFNERHDFLITPNIRLKEKGCTKSGMTQFMSPQSKSVFYILTGALVIATVLIVSLM